MYAKLLVGWKKKNHSAHVANACSTTKRNMPKWLRGSVSKKLERRVLLVLTIEKHKVAPISSNFLMEITNQDTRTDTCNTIAWVAAYNNPIYELICNLYEYRPAGIDTILKRVMLYIHHLFISFLFCYIKCDIFIIK